jgi:hypothetical protein
MRLPAKRICRNAPILNTGAPFVEPNPLGGGLQILNRTWNSDLGFLCAIEESSETVLRCHGKTLASARRVALIDRPKHG